MSRARRRSGWSRPSSSAGTGPERHAERREEAETVAAGIRVPRAIGPEGGATPGAYDDAPAAGQLARDDGVVLFDCAAAPTYPLPDRARTLDRHAPIDYAGQ